MQTGTGFVIGSSDAGSDGASEMRKRSLHVRPASFTRLIINGICLITQAYHAHLLQDLESPRHVADGCAARHGCDFLQSAQPAACPTQAASLLYAERSSVPVRVQLRLLTVTAMRFPLGIDGPRTHLSCPGWHLNGGGICRMRRRRLSANLIHMSPYFSSSRCGSCVDTPICSSSDPA